MLLSIVKVPLILVLPVTKSWPPILVVPLVAVTWNLFPPTTISPENKPFAACKSASVPVKTSLVLVASFKRTKRLALSSQPIKPTLALPSLYLNSTPRSRLSSVVLLPIVITGSSTDIVLVFTIVWFPETVKLPLIVISLKVTLSDFCKAWSITLILLPMFVWSILA